MAEEILRLGINPRGAERGSARFRAAATGASTSANKLALAVGAAGAAMVAFAGARQVGSAVRGLIEFDAAMTQSLAIMGDVSEAMEGRMVAAARQVGEELNFAADQSAEAVFFLASAGLDAEQSVAALPAVAQFARAGMFDLATATDLATDAQSALGLASEDTQENLRNMTRVTDTLVKANTLANATVQQFSTALTTEAGAAMKTFNIDVEEGVAVLSAFADQGFKGQTAGSGFSRVLRLMSSAAVNNREEMEQLGIEFFDAEGNMRNMADVVENLTGVLGPMSDAQRAAALESIGFTARVQGIIQPLLGTSDAIREYEKGLREAGGTTQEVSDNQMQSLENRIGQIKREFENWRTEMAERTVPAIEAFVENVDVAVDAVVALAVAVGAVGAAGLVGAMASLAPAVWGSVAAFAALTASVNSLSGAFALLQVAIGPVGWVLAGITAITAAVFSWRRENRKTEEAQDALNESLERGKKIQEELAKLRPSNLAEQIDMEGGITVTVPGGGKDLEADMERVQLLQEAHRLRVLNKQEAIELFGTMLEIQQQLEAGVEDTEKRLELTERLKGFWEEIGSPVREVTDHFGRMPDHLQAAFERARRLRREMQQTLEAFGLMHLQQRQANIDVQLSTLGGGGGGFMSKLGETIERVVGVFDGLWQGVKGVLSALNPWNLLLQAISHALGDFLRNTTPIIEMLGSALTPILKALFPVFKGVTIAATYLGQVLFNVAGGITKAIGFAIRTIGKAIDLIPFVSGESIINAGQKMMDLGQGFLEAAAELATARDQIKALEWTEATDDLADSTGNAADEMERFAGALRNLPQGFKVALERFRATDPMFVPRGPGSSPGTGGPNEPNEGTNIEVAVTIAAPNGQQLFEVVEVEARRARSRGGSSSLTTRPRVARA